jgi:hypothetical protein
MIDFLNAASHSYLCALVFWACAIASGFYIKAFVRTWRNTSRLDSLISRDDMRRVLRARPMRETERIY